ncbi:Dual specificity tyrosine-phosphorylation-regulated kinase 2 [Folsomia candida]|uniref:dual-specificity kinase n=1 Tax=Folsomia candida TaxID=158441 RepID=A0A226E530_FOLCA|nr:Dual specificity tyrosine-phosphorylation-regulated kinase 2 [Folsomia candida]
MSSGTTALLSAGLGLGVNNSKFQNIDMPLSRTRSLLSNINGTANGSLNGDSNGDSFLPHVLNDSHHGSHHHLPPLKGGPQSLVTAKQSYVGLDVGVGMIQRLLSNGSDDSSSGGGGPTSMLPPTSTANGTLTNGGIGMSNGSLNNYSHMSVSTTQIQSQSLPPATIARPASADFTVGPSTPLSGESNKMTPNRTKYKSVPVSPEQVIKLYHSRLTPYEISEINSYPEVYFIGLGAKKRPGIVGSSNNNGYDDDQGSYVHVQHDHVGYRYEVLKVIGKGSFGQVVKAYDHKCNVHVALKMVRNEKRFHRQAQEEIRILEHLRDLDKDNNMNIIHMCDHFTFRSHTCITFELLSLNLYELIKKNKFQGFSLQLVRKFAHSLLQCLDALARNKIIHCDMKPENVLLKQQGRSGIKLHDYGPTGLAKKDEGKEQVFCCLLI